MREVEEQLPTREQAEAAFLPARAASQQRVRAALAHLATDPPQVLVLEGGTAEERYAMALWYAANLNCEAGESKPCLHCPTCLQIGAGLFSDLFVLDGRDGGIKIAAVRELRVVLGEPPRGTGKRVIVLAEAQFLGNEAANALLKSLEEPRPGICFLLLAPQRERLLPTLVSRGWALTLAWPEAGAALAPGVAQWEEALAEFLASGQGWFARTAVKGAVDAHLAREILALVQKTIATVLVGRSFTPLCQRFVSLPPAGYLYLSDVLKQCQESLDAMVNPALVLDWLATRLYLACKKRKVGTALLPQASSR